MNKNDTNERAQKLREKLIADVSKTGGHLAPSLGVVELTMALHEVFESPKDSIIWDVGHQAYAHKILTGRSDRFHTLRQKGGISGFPKRSESEHDPFGAGHSSTSISAALGIAEAKSLSGDSGKTIAVIGDGSLTAGLAYEGLNNAGGLQNKNLIVVFNDNKMSIDKNVGALSRFINRGLTNPTFNRIRRDMKVLLNLISTKDLNILELTRRAALVVKDFFLAGSLFEAFGFRYIGPVDGHNLEELIETLKKISQEIDMSPAKSNPILLHVITKKGKGYKPAEEDPTKFHGVGPFDIETGELVKPAIPKPPSYTEVFGETICKMMAKDSRIVAITAAMPDGTGLNEVKETYPGRYYDVGIAEQHAVTFAAGLATRGFRPMVAIYSSFLQRAYDSIVHDVCLQNLPVIFAIDRAGVVGADGPTHHGVFDISFLRQIPAIAIAAPKDEEELRQMLISAPEYGIPIAIRYPRGCGLGVKAATETVHIPLGKSEVVRSHSRPIAAIFAIGNMTEVACDAADRLEGKGMQVDVINARFAKPIDETMLNHYAQKCKTFITIEDNVLMGGYGSAVLEFLSDRGISDVTVKRIGYRDEFIGQGSISEIHEMHGLTSENVIKTITGEDTEKPVTRDS
jgi:1-deoxy-D-xylulose-5-phosphate synthase